MTVLSYPAAYPLVIVLLFVTAGCGDDSDAEENPANQGPAVGVLELPISHRAADQEPTNAIAIEISPSEIRVDGTKAVDLTSGRLAEEGDVIGPLSSAISTGAARSAATLRVHVNTPYGTMARVLNTLKAANINTVGFAVRPVANPNTSGFLVLNNYSFVASPEEAEFPNGVQRNWDEFVAGWEDIYTGCRRAHYVDCSGKAGNPAEGGSVRITLFSRGSALKVDFNRFGVEDEPSGTAAPEMLDGVPAPLPAEGEPEPPPSVFGSFTWRFEAATDELSPIKDAFRPICGNRQCGVVQTADEGTLSMRILSMWGAAFPTGTEAPHVAFVIPSP